MCAGCDMAPDTRRANGLKGLVPQLSAPSDTTPAAPSSACSLSTPKARRAARAAAKCSAVSRAGNCALELSWKVTASTGSGCDACAMAA